jgi:hypothetical protein
MIAIFCLLIPFWINPIEITPDSSWCQFSMPLVVSDEQGKCWFVWSYENISSGNYYILGRYYEGSSLSPIDTIMPLNFVMHLTDLDRDQNHNVWVLTEHTPDVWTRYRNSSGWSDSMLVPGFQPYDNFGSTSCVDSSGNYWVAWTTDVNIPYSVYSCFYDGNSWSGISQVSNLPYESFSEDITAASDSLIWLTWICYYGLTDSLFISTFDGASWNTDYCLAGDISWPNEYSRAVIQASISDEYVYLSYRKTDGYICVLRFLSNQDSPDTIWLTNEFESTPVLSCDDLGHLWMFFCDSLGQFDYRVYYSIWQDDSLTTPQLVDTLDGYNPRTAFDLYSRRMWVSFKTWRDGDRKIYATYENVPGIAESKQNLRSFKNHLVCSPNPFTDGLFIEYSTPRNDNYHIRIYDITGRFIRELRSPTSANGILFWNGTDGFGNRVTPGIYLIVVDSVIVQKVIKTE